MLHSAGVGRGYGSLLVVFELGGTDLKFQRIGRLNRFVVRFDCSFSRCLVAVELFIEGSLFVLRRRVFQACFVVVALHMGFVSTDSQLCAIGPLKLALTCMLRFAGAFNLRSKSWELVLALHDVTWM